MSKVIIVTAAGRGLGTDIAGEALAAGHRVVATGRRPEQVEKTLGGPQDNLLTVELDITNPEDAQSAVQAAVERFGRIDVLVNNAGNFFAGYFEEISPEHLRQQIETNLFGPLNVTRAVLPVLRKQRAGHVITISSLAGLIGQEFCAAYAASKFGLEGWMESLRFDVAPYGIHTTIVEPGFFRTELLVDSSTTWPDVDRGLRPPYRRDDRNVEEPQRRPTGGPRQTRSGAYRHHRTGRTAAALRRRRRRHRCNRRQSQRTTRPGTSLARSRGQPHIRRRQRLNRRGPRGSGCPLWFGVVCGQRP